MQGMVMKKNKQRMKNLLSYVMLLWLNGIIWRKFVLPWSASVPMRCEDCDKRMYPKPRDPSLRRRRWECRLFPKRSYSPYSELKSKQNKLFNATNLIANCIVPEKRRLLKQICLIISQLFRLTIERASS